MPLRADNFYLSVQPIAGPIAPMKQAARRHYGSHPYFTKRAWNVVQQYIKTFSQAGDVVLDPFGGSGVTAVEALVLRRRAIHVDISPLANFLCHETYPLKKWGDFNLAKVSAHYAANSD